VALTDTGYNLFTPYRATNEPGPSQRCFIFAWIGQSFNTCDECGQPDYKHLYRYLFGNERPDLYVKHFAKHLRRWEWRPVKIQERSLV
jgi:hypothetical protein